MAQPIPIPSNGRLRIPFEFQPLKPITLAPNPEYASLIVLAPLDVNEDGATEYKPIIHLGSAAGDITFVPRTNSLLVIDLNAGVLPTAENLTPFIAQFEAQNDAKRPAPGSVGGGGPS